MPLVVSSMFGWDVGVTECGGGGGGGGDGIDEEEEAEMDGGGGGDDVIQRSVPTRRGPYGCCTTRRIGRRRRGWNTNGRRLLAQRLLPLVAVLPVSKYGSNIIIIVIVIRIFTRTFWFA